MSGLLPKKAYTGLALGRKISLVESSICDIVNLFAEYYFLKQWEGTYYVR